MRTARSRTLGLLAIAAAIGASADTAAAQTFPSSPVSIPFFTGSFAYAGQTYSYRIVGSDPAGPPRTTRIGVQLVPLRFVFAGGRSFSPEPILPAVLRSPLFRAARFRSGFTQYADAMLRAEFWRSVRGRNWHVLLVPRPLRVVTVRVPRADGWSAHSVYGGVGAVVKEPFWHDRVIPALIRRLRLDPHELTLFLAYDVHIEGPSYNGAHGSYVEGSRVWTYADATWLAPDLGCCALYYNVFSLSHEIAEWLHNPFAAMRELSAPTVVSLQDNLVPPWRTGEIGCYSYFEVADALDALPVRVEGYSLADVAFLSWFARQRPSNGIAGRYDYLGTLHAPPQSCQLGAPYG